MNIKDNVVLVTGGARGIGLALAERFLREGNKVLICDKDKHELRNVKIRLPEINTIYCDILDGNSINQMISLINKKHNELNIIINNAGIQNIGKFNKKEFSLEKILDEINTNLLGPIILIKKLLPILQNKNSAAIVNVSSLLAKIYKESAPIYCATKAGLHAFSRSLRYQLEDTNIKVFEIMPPIVETTMTEGRGKGKLTPEALVDEFFHSFSRDNYQVEVGKTKVLFSLQRFFPHTIDKYIRNG